jgi:hypothetical protein
LPFYNENKHNGNNFMQRIQSLRWYRWGYDPERKIVLPIETDKKMNKEVSA